MSKERYGKDTAPHASFENWNPKEYLREYYSYIEPDETEAMRFFVKTVSDIGFVDKILFFGTGPTLHHVFLAGPIAQEIHLADYLAPNRDELKKWVNKDDESHDWTAFVSYTLACEGVPFPTDDEVREREEIIRAKVTVIDETADAGKSDPLGVSRRGIYPVVFSPFCADSATADKKVWEEYMRNIATLVAPGGKFVTAALRKCKSYVVGGKAFPSADIDEDDMERVLQLDFLPESTTIVVKELKGHEQQGYSGIILAHATKAA